MSDIYMNRVFGDTFKNNFKPETNNTNYIPVEYWQISKKRMAKSK